jgi:hypothetical protein
MRAPQVLRDRPEAWFLPAAALSLVTAFTAAGQSTLGPAVLRRLAFMAPDPILPFTLAAAVITGPYVAIEFRRRTTMALWRSILVGVSVPVGGVGLFEIPYQEIRAQVYPALTGGLSVGAAVALLAWVLVGFTGIGWMKVDRAVVIVGGLLIAGFAVWWLVGYPQVETPPGGNRWVAYAFNVSLKWACFAFFAALARGEVSGVDSKVPCSSSPGV